MTPVDKDPEMRAERSLTPDRAAVERLVRNATYPASFGLTPRDLWGPDDD